MKLCNLKRYFATGFALMISVSLIGVVSAQEQSSIEGLMREDVVAMASADLTKVNLLKLNQWATKTGIVSQKEAGEFKFKLAAAQGILGGLVDSGVDRISVLFRISDLETYSPIWIASIDQDKDAAEAKDALKEVLDLIPLPPQVLQVEDGKVIGGPTQQELDSYLKSNSSAHPQLSGGLETGQQHVISLLITGSPETRRVVREMFPDLPKPFEEATGELIADKSDWGGLFLDLPPEIDLEVVIQTKDNESAKTMGRLAIATMKYAAENAPANLAQIFNEGTLAKVTKEVVGNKVVLNGKAVLADLKLVEKVASVTNEQLGRQQQQENIRNVVIGMLNYESAYGNFPQVAIYSEEGKPLLSWRVAILPFLEENALHGAFHLDEPWDSPHNLPLAEKMPAIYANFGSASNVKAPKTTVQVPYGEGLMFEGKDLRKFGDLTDGSSNTIAVVSAHPKNAVCWTKPADWEVDLKNPWDGLKRDDKEKIVVAFSDGSQLLWDPGTITKEDLAAMLTRAGGEVVLRP